MHTRGPWRVKGYSEGPRVTIESEKDCIATVWENKEVSRWMETLSNAHLIAAAPELLEACKSALNFIKSQYPVDHGQEQVGKAWVSLESATNKAEGK